MAGPMADLIRKHGGEAVEAPALREVPIGDNPEALAFAERLIAGEFDLVIFLTGVGTRYLAQEIETKYPREQWVAALKRAKVVIRGPKPLVPLREWGSASTSRPPSPTPGATSSRRSTPSSRSRASASRSRSTASPTPS